MAITLVIIATVLLSIGVISESAFTRYALPEGSNGKEHPYVAVLATVWLFTKPAGVGCLYIAFIVAIVEFFIP